MGREVRRVPPDWQHPRDERGRYVPLFDGANLNEDTYYFESYKDEWRAEYGPDLGGERRPNPDDYMPVWDEREATAWCVYENVSEGTPWSPVFTEPEAVVRWLVEVAHWNPEAAAQLAVNGYAFTSEALAATR